MECISNLPRTARITVGVLAVPAICLVLVMAIRELLFANSKSFQDTGGLIVVYLLAASGPILCMSVPRLKFVHWLPVMFIGVAQFAILTLAKPTNEWWLYFVVAPFTVGVPALALVVYKHWYAPRFGLQ